MTQFHFVVNPAGAGGEAGKIWEKTEKLLQQKNTLYEVHFSRPDRGIAEIVQELNIPGKEVNVIVLGGDGTFNEAVNGIRDYEHLRMGFIPCGSGNDLAKDLAVPGLEESLAVMLKGETVRTTDVGLVRFYTKADTVEEEAVPSQEVRMFNVSCGIGYDAEICWLAEHSALKGFLNRLRMGKLIYLMKGTELIFKAKKYPVRITDSEGTVSVYDRCLFAVAMNHRFEGGGVMFCPHAAADDGRLDLCAADGLNSFDFFRIVPHTYTGKHLRYKGVHEKRSTSFRIQCDVPLWVHTDGEIAGASSDIEVGVLPGKLNLLI
ncbi:MAG: hypothetical protein IIZ14_06100 [Solobacterium sp.]|nr:hypothetical protein [Solobacterium sp.]